MVLGSALRKLFGLLYLAGLLLVIDQLADLAATLLSSTVSGDAESWRFGAFGLIASRLSVFLIADVMFFAAASVLDHRKVLRTLGVLHLVFAPLLLLGLVSFLLDWVQVRHLGADGRTRPVDLAALRAAILAALWCLLSAWGGVVGYRAGRPHHRGTHREGEPAPLLPDIRRDRSAI